jgi:hypothetical protein
LGRPGCAERGRGGKAAQNERKQKRSSAFHN